MNDLFIRDNPDRVDPPEEPGEPLCYGCKEHLNAPFYDCDGIRLCEDCAIKYAHDTKKAPVEFTIWIIDIMQDWQQYT